MKADSAVITELNAALKGQLTVINQTFLHARMAKNWGLEELNEHEYKASIKAMKMADDLIERILFLEALPGMQALNRLQIGENIPEVFAGDMSVHMEVRQQLVGAIDVCEKAQDYVSRDMLTEVLEETEEQIDWIETQQWLIDNSGLQNYLAARMED
ncbi:bacterioferritin [Oceanospirillum sediminis]|uniref:Bacterioferritin n=1 Tax=Oceanospirillum sediminis TaxID=2760088 RepID=A0A839ING6_9GAMM|nr:bacterioferritin [Oceanospirillum sediminis]MBB1486240.1 bacterioferritin [Oceanospirillum sediminis]